MFENEFRGGTRPKAFRDNLLARTIASKLVADPNKGRYTRKFANDTEAPMAGTLDQISKWVSGRITDSENILETLPDTELAMRIIVSSIISPSDLRIPELSFKCEEAKLDPGLIGELISIVEKHFTTDYKIKDQLEKCLEDALFRTGSYVLAVVPENTLDDIINGRSKKASMEGFAKAVASELDKHRVPKCIGNLGAIRSNNPIESLNRPSLESVIGLESSQPQIEYDSQIHQGLYVTDNPSALTLGLVADLAVGSKVRKNVTGASKIKVAYENVTTMNDLINRVYRRPTNKMSEVVRIQERGKGSRAPIGHPLVMKLPSESVIPVHIPSDPEKHLGYFVLLDDLGHPVNTATDSTHYADLQQRLQLGSQANSEQTNILQNLTFMRNGFSCGANATALSLTQSYANAVEKDLIERLRNGAYGDNVEIAKTNEAYRIMLSRVFAGQRTMILYVPSELVTYMAFHYTKSGIGRSLLDKNKMLASLRATMMFANVMGALKNSVARQKVSIELDEADTDPEKAVDAVLTDLARLRTRATPFGTTSPTDIIDGIQAASMSVEVRGNPRYPELTVGVEDVQSARVQPDTELSERLDKQWWMSLGLAPEIIDSLQQIEFAAVQMTQNALMTKRTAMDQATLCGFWSDHVRKYVDNDGTLLTQLILAVRKFRAAEDQTELEDDDLMSGAEEAVAEPEPTDTADDSGLEFNEQGMAVGVASAEEETEETEESPYQDLKDASDMEIIQEFLNTLTVNLPPPDTTRIQVQAEEFGQYSSFLDEAIPAYISQDIISKVGGPEAAEHANDLVGLVKAHYQREWLIRNNVLPELQELSAAVEEGSAGVVENYLSFQESIGEVLSKLLTALHQKNNPDDQGGGGGYDTGGDTGGDDTGGDDDYGGDDLPGDDLDAGMDDLDADAGEGDSETGTGEDTESGDDTGGDADTDANADVDSPEDDTAV